MTFRLDRTYPDSGRKNIWKADFRCHHNTRNKKTVGKGKNCDCKSTMTIIVKRVLVNTRSSDPYIKEWPTIVTIKMFHNHPLNAAPALKYRSVSKDVENKLIELFHNGHTPLSALKAHKVDLMLEHGDNYTSVSEDRRICPDQSYCYRLYYKMIGGSIKSQEKAWSASVATNDDMNCVEVPKKKRGNKKKKQKSQPASEVVLSLPSGADVANQNIVVHKNDGATALVVQSMHVAQMDELQAAVQALEQGGTYTDLQSLGLTFSQSPSVDSKLCSSGKDGWTPSPSDGNVVNDGADSSLAAVPQQQPERVKERYANQLSPGFRVSQSQASPLSPMNETVSMDVTLAPANPDNTAVEPALQLQGAFVQISLPESSSQDLWQGLRQPRPLPHFTQAGIGQHFHGHQQIFQPELHSLQVQSSQSQIPQQLVGLCPPVHLQPVSVSQPEQNITQQFPVLETNSTAATCHPVIASILTEVPVNRTETLSEQVTETNILPTSEADEVFADSSGQNCNNKNDQTLGHDLALDVAHVECKTFPAQPGMSCSRQVTVGVEPMEIVTETAVTNKPEPDVSLFGADGGELDLQTWVQRFLSVLRDKFFSSELYQSAFARLRKNVEQNAKTDLALCSALSNLAKRPLKSPKPSMNVVYNPDRGMSSGESSSLSSKIKRCVSNLDVRDTGPLRKCSPSRVNKFQFRSRSALPTRKQGGKYLLERNRFGQWRRSFKRRHWLGQRRATQEAPGLQEILDSFDTVESEQQREREKEGAEALLQMEARAVMKTDVSDSLSKPESAELGGTCSIQDDTSEYVENCNADVVDSTEGGDECISVDTPSTCTCTPDDPIKK